MNNQIKKIENYSEDYPWSGQVERYDDDEKRFAERQKIEAEAQNKLEEGKITEKQVERIEARIETNHTRKIKKFKIINEYEESTLI